MPQKATSHVDQKTKQQNDGLPVSIHPDDAKDKVFTAILKALIKMGNKPSSPKELANTIVKHKYATLGYVMLDLYIYIYICYYLALTRFFFFFFFKQWCYTFCYSLFSYISTFQTSRRTQSTQSTVIG